MLQKISTILMVLHFCLSYSKAVGFEEDCLKVTVQTQKLTPIQQESLEEIEITMPRPNGFDKNLLLNQSVKSIGKASISLAVGAGSAGASSMIFASNPSIAYFLYPNTGKYFDSSSTGIPMATLLVIPSVNIVHELLDDLTNGFEKPGNKKEMLKLVAKVANLGLAAQGIVGDIAVFGRVSWSSSIPKVRENFNEGTYYLAGTYVLTGLLDRISTGNGVIDWCYDSLQYAMNRKAEGTLVKKTIVAELQSQLRHAYQEVVDMDDAQVLRMRQQIGQAFHGAKTNEQKQHAKLQSLMLLMGLAGDDSDKSWSPKNKPWSLQAAKAFFGTLGFTLGYGATLGTYWAFDEDNRFDPETGYKFLQPLDSPDAWAYSTVFGAYASFVGLMTGRKLGEDLWAMLTGQDVNQYRRLPEFQPQNVRGVRTLVSLVNLLAVRGLAEIPNAGMSTELLLTANKEISFFTYQRRRQQALLAGALMGYIVSSHREFDRHYQSLITVLARWRRTDPLTTARDDLRKMVIQFHDGIGDLDPEQTQSLSELLQKARAAEMAEGMGAAADGGGVAGAGPDAVAVDMGAGLAAETDVDGERSGLRDELLTEAQRAASGSPSSGSGSGSGSGVEELDYALGEEESQQLIDEDRAQGKGWFTRLRTWLLGPDVPVSLQDLVDTIPVS
jgi:hypothetical protein